MKVLAINTANETLNLAVVEDEKVLGNIMLNGKKNHSVTLMPNLTHLFHQLHLTPEDISRVVVTQGPGSYTGLRIGVTFAKTFSWTLQKELVGVSTLETLACNIHQENVWISPILDARRGNVYAGLYCYENGKIKTVLNDRHISFSSWLVLLKEKGYQQVLFLGQWQAFANAIQKEKHQINPIEAFDSINGLCLAQLGKQKQAVENIDAFTPCYLKRVEAEEKWQALHPKQKIEDEDYVVRR